MIFDDMSLSKKPELSLDSFNYTNPWETSLHNGLKQNKVDNSQINSGLYETFKIIVNKEFFDYNNPKQP